MHIYRYLYIFIQTNNCCIICSLIYSTHLSICSVSVSKLALNLHLLYCSFNAVNSTTANLQDMGYGLWKDTEKFPKPQPQRYPSASKTNLTSIHEQTTVTTVVQQPGSGLTNELVFAPTASRDTLGANWRGKHMSSNYLKQQALTPQEAYQPSDSSSSRDWLLSEAHCRHHMLPSESLHQIHQRSSDPRPSIHGFNTSSPHRSVPLLPSWTPLWLWPSFRGSLGRGVHRKEEGIAPEETGSCGCRATGAPTDQQRLKQEGAKSKKQKK